MKITDKYVFFWGGDFSNWATSPIVIEPGTIICNVLITSKLILPTAEHYFMVHKALFFKDLETFSLILNSVTPKEAKKLGRKVSGFDESKWETEREIAMMEALRYKFLQNSGYRDQLLSKDYRDKTFVEASPYDRIWGIGVGEDDPNLLDESRWGLNLLGKCLCNVRKELLC